MDTDLAKRVFSCIDNTTLNATDSEALVEAFCRHTLDLSLQWKEESGDHSDSGSSLSTLHFPLSTCKVAAVCVYPRFVRCAKRVLDGSGIKVASVAGAFPHGQLPIELKVREVEYAVEEGAEEVDVVLSRGLMLEGCDDEVRSEVEQMKRACQGRTLKVILETGELKETSVIARASRLAIEGGADFIKTSTGKISVGATLEAADVMLQVLSDHVKKTKKTVGFKAAGGIRKPEEALAYAHLAQKIMGDEFVKNQTFRIGASSLTDSLFSVLT